MNVPLPDDPLSILSRSIFTANGLLLSAGESIAGPLNISVAKWHVLGRANYKNRTVAQIARYIGVSRQSVQRIANDLERDGLITFTQKKSDARTRTLHLTAKGRDILGHLYNNDKRWSEGFIKNIDPTFLTNLAHQLDDFSKRLAEYSERTFYES